MKHVHYVFYLLSNIGMLVIFRYDGISIATECVLFLVFLYLYYLCTINHVNDTWQHTKCVKCKRMTPQHWVHCEICNRCVNITYTHYEILNDCALKQNYYRYISLLRFIISLNLVLSVIGLVLYPYIILFVAGHLIVLKSTYNRDQGDIYVK